MHPRAEQLIRELRLVPHREGGWFREVFRSRRVVLAGAPAARRAALTTIYFLLAGEARSRWHRVAGEEVWHFYEGDPLELLWVEPQGWGMERRVLGPPAAAGAPVLVVPAGNWQAASTLGEYSLVGCTMGPGFDDDDFGLLADDPEAAAEIRARHPRHAHLI